MSHIAGNRIYFSDIIKVTTVLRILIYCISLLSFVACDDNYAQEYKRRHKTRPVPGLVLPSELLKKMIGQGGVPKDTVSVMNDALCK